MIARIWRGRVRASDLAEYRDYIARTGLADYQTTAGNRGAYMLTNVVGAVGHVVTLSFWVDLDSIRAFAGDDITKARYYPEDERFLLDFPEFVEHFDVLSA